MSESAARAIHRDGCSCGSKSNACCNGAECSCTTQLRAPAKVSAVIDFSSDPTQLAVLANKSVDIESPANVPTLLGHSSTFLAGFTTNLIAQGTRLNI
ncbi:MAG: hypothetical protein AB7I57_19265 [Pirellulales bacterium]